MSGMPAPLEDRDPAPVLALIERMATDPAADVEKLERLMAMHERLLARRAREDFAAALVAMRPELPKIKRSRYNSQTQSFYAPLEDIIEVIDPILHKFNFAIATKVTEQTETRITVRAELWHGGGHVEHTDVQMPLDDKGLAGRANKTPLHATASAITYGKRYAVCAILNIATGVDNDGNLPPRGFSRNAASQNQPLPEYESPLPQGFMVEPARKIAAEAPGKPAERDVLAEAREAAQNGLDALRAFWKAQRYVEDRKVIDDNLGELESIAARAAERSRQLAEMEPFE